MNATVKYVHMNDSGAKLGLCFPGTKYAHCVMNFDSGISILKIDLKEYQRMRVVTDATGAAYDPKRVAQTFIDYTKRQVARREITIGARELLEKILGVESVESDQPPVEPVAVVKHVTAPSVLAEICKELKLEPSVARRRLRAAGLAAPYIDAKAIRAALEAK